MVWIVTLFFSLQAQLPALDFNDEDCQHRWRADLANDLYLSPSADFQKTLFARPSAQWLGGCKSDDWVISLEVDGRTDQIPGISFHPWLYQSLLSYQKNEWSWSIGVSWDPWVEWNHRYWDHHLTLFWFKDMGFRMGWLPASEGVVQALWGPESAKVGIRLAHRNLGTATFGKDLVLWASYEENDMELLLYGRWGFYDMIGEHSHHRHRMGFSWVGVLHPGRVRWGLSYLHHQTGVDGVIYEQLNGVGHALPFSFSIDSSGYEGSVVEGGAWGFWLALGSQLAEWIARWEKAQVFPGQEEAQHESWIFGYRKSLSSRVRLSAYLVQNEFGKRFSILSQTWGGIVFEWNSY